MTTDESSKKGEAPRHEVVAGALMWHAHSAETGSELQEALIRGHVLIVAQQMEMDDLRSALEASNKALRELVDALDAYNAAVGEEAEEKCLPRIVSAKRAARRVLAPALVDGAEKP